MNKKNKRNAFVCVPFEVIGLDYSNLLTHRTQPKPSKLQLWLERGNHKIIMIGVSTIFHFVTHLLRFPYDSSIVL
jgi:hypothetical protein